MTFWYGFKVSAIVIVIGVAVVAVGVEARERNSGSSICEKLRVECRKPQQPLPSVEDVRRGMGCAVLYLSALTGKELPDEKCAEIWDLIKLGRKSGYRR